MISLMTFQAGEPATVPSVDLDRYAGRWLEIARFPNRFQKQCVSDVTADYARRADGRIDVTNRCLRQDGILDEARGVARVVDPTSNAKLKVRFAPAWLSVFPFGWGDYWIVGLAEDYRFAVVGSPNREYLWVLSRAPELPAEDWEEALQVARRNGFDVSRLLKTKQTPSS